jgi:regulation of enolase protein 1 (concanavalin A-like superfamily)
MASDFTLAARVEMMFRSTFGAGALVVCQDDGSGAKLAFESAPQGHRTIVSVVTRGESDDCNSVVVDSEALWLRMARLGRAHAFHVALDGRDWRVVRHFRIGDRWRTRGGVRGAVAARRGLRGTILRDQLRGRDAG